MNEERTEARLDLNPSLVAEKKVQHMPFSIDYSGPAKIDEYFETTVRRSSLQGGKELLDASFRGRSLNGQSVDLPNDYEGLIMHNGSVTGKFSSVTSWNLDKTPSSEDPFNRVVDWLGLSAAMHDPICPEKQ